MLKRAIRMLNPDATIRDLSKMSGVSEVTLYAINTNPEHKSITLPTLEAIYLGSKKLYGQGLVPSDYLKNCVLKFSKDK